MLLLLLPLVAAILLFVTPPPHYTPRPEPNSLQQTLYQRLSDAGLQGDELATVGALTLGYKEDLGKDLLRHFRASGAAHVLAVSGLHTGIIYGILLWLLTLGGHLRPRHENKFGRRSISLTIIVAMWGYAWLTGLTPSVVRAVLMVTVFEVGRMLYRQAFSINTISTAAFLILLIRPTDLWSVSFQLSFTATTAIVIVARKCELYLHRLDWLKTRIGKLAHWIVGMIIVSLAAQLGTLPLTMYYFHQFSNYFLLTNLIVLPLATFLVPCGLITIVLGGTPIGLIAGRITHYLAWLMNHAVEWIENLPGSTTYIQINLPMVFIYYALLVGLMLLLSIKRTKTIRKNK